MTITLIYPLIRPLIATLIQKSKLRLNSIPWSLFLTPAITLALCPLARLPTRQHPRQPPPWHACLHVSPSLRHSRSRSSVLGHVLWTFNAPHAPSMRRHSGGMFLLFFFFPRLTATPPSMRLRCLSTTPVRVNAPSKRQRRYVAFRFFTTDGNTPAATPKRLFLMVRAMHQHQSDGKFCFFPLFLTHPHRSAARAATASSVRARPTPDAHAAVPRGFSARLRQRHAQVHTHTAAPPHVPPLAPVRRYSWVANTTVTWHTAMSHRHDIRWRHNMR